MINPLDRVGRTNHALCMSKSQDTTRGYATEVEQQVATQTRATAEPAVSIPPRGGFDTRTNTDRTRSRIELTYLSVTRFWARYQSRGIVVK